MLNRCLLNFVAFCVVSSMLFVAAGCAKKAQVAPPPAEETKAEDTYKEESIGGTPGEDTSTKAESGEFGEMDVPSTSGEFVPTPNLAAIHFDFDQYSIRGEDKDILNQNASWLSTYAAVAVRIEGHCDARGTSDYNLALGDRRSTATKDYLVSLGINPFRISTVTFGEEKPLCTENEESCWSQNRRAEFLMAR